MKQHIYTSQIVWTGNNGTGTDHYKNYERSHIIAVPHKQVIEGSSDPAFRGDHTKHNPEDLFLSSLSSCHMLWYLHFCAAQHIIVEEYMDMAEGIMLEERDGRGYFSEVTLHPTVVVKTEDMIQTAIELHQKANEYCFMANSVKFPIKHFPVVRVG
ncbi:OsmC family protein [Sphingobacterium sp. SYP-B4668]|uniref:OsmC family protein n=1 Tax=Sphingobacterium sp. SYP-B4668 TaxID=2996035 RepID=UPI0022DDB873|nr:OsmC family protein [Sphingobacterium sp. SYP-B4668]